MTNTQNIFCPKVMYNTAVNETGPLTNPLVSGGIAVTFTVDGSVELYADWTGGT